jgi:hypothetical protein
MQAEVDVQTAALAVHERDNCIVQSHKNQTEKAELQVYALKAQLAAENVATTRKIAHLQVRGPQPRRSHVRFQKCVCVCVCIVVCIFGVVV